MVGGMGWSHKRTLAMSKCTVRKGPGAGVQVSSFEPIQTCSGTSIPNI